jgi:hypothetical protein
MPGGPRQRATRPFVLSPIKRTSRSVALLAPRRPVRTRGRRRGLLARVPQVTQSCQCGRPRHTTGRNERPLSSHSTPRLSPSRERAARPKQPELSSFPGTAWLPSVSAESYRPDVGARAGVRLPACSCKYAAAYR